MKKIFTWKVVLLAIIILAAVLRLYQLGNIPYGVPDDEASYIYNAYTIWNTGKDIEGKFMPLSFNAHSSQSPVPIYVTAPFVGLLGLSPFSGRLPSAILSIGSVLLLFLIADRLFKNKRIALFSALLLSISPWALQIGRGGLLDVDFALFFFLVGIYLFIANIKTRSFLWSLIPFALAFYSYHATKVYFVFLIPVLIFYFREELLKRKKAVIIFLGICLLILASFALIVKFQTVTRQADVSLLSDPQAAKTVNSEREYNTAPWILRMVFNNKPLYFLRVVRENYLQVFSPEFLFLYGETGQLARTDNIFLRGEFYIIELPFLLFGVYLLIRSKNKYSRNLLFALLLISATPSAFTLDKNFVDRDIMLLPALIIIIAYGLYSFLDIIRRQKNIYKYCLITGVCLIYVFLFSSYLYQYYFRWTVYGAEGWDASSHDLANFVEQNKNKFDNIYIEKQGNDFLLKYAIFYRIDSKTVQANWNKEPIKINNITIFPTCFNNGYGDVRKFLTPKTLYVTSYKDCNYISTPSATIIDRGEPLHIIYNIYEN
jgi:4-amino-4-deoxy-L-arabinose transferase-like glycosyltransferase